jgi:enterochelin esterase-like enzyme
MRLAMDRSATIIGARAGPAASRKTISTRLVAVVFISLVVDWTPATAHPTNRCPDTPHGFETFSRYAPALDRSKQIWVYLPPGYDCAKNKRYPVFYFNDGQDLFDWNPFASDLAPALAAEIAAREAWYGSWRLDSQLDRAIADGDLPPMIVVGIASDDGMRSRDLVPVPWSGSAEGRGAQYGSFIARTVVPAIDSRFRTIDHRRCRGIGGASLGGVSALQIGLAHPDSFGMVLSFSPVLSDPAIANYLAVAWPIANLVGPTVFLIDFDDGRIGTADLEWFASVVGTAANSGGRVVLVQTPGTRHAISSWAERAIPALNQLFDAQCSD